MAGIRPYAWCNAKSAHARGRVGKVSIITQYNHSTCWFSIVTKPIFRHKGSQQWRHVGTSARELSVGLNHWRSIKFSTITATRARADPSGQAARCCGSCPELPHMHASPRKQGRQVKTAQTLGAVRVCKHKATALLSCSPTNNRLCSSVSVTPL